jgi:hypothetical protein
MESYRFELRFRLAAELKQSYSYIEMVRCLSTAGLQDVVLKWAGFLGYKGTPLDLRLPPHMVAEEAEIIGHTLIRKLGEALGWDPRHFSGTLVLIGQGRARAEDAETIQQTLAGQGFAVSLELAGTR